MNNYQLYSVFNIFNIFNGAEGKTMTAASNEEMRWSDRREIMTDVKVVFNNRTYYARTHDVGLGGMFIDLNYVLIPRDTHIKVIMLQYQYRQLPISFLTRVAYVTPHGYGLEFKDFKTHDVRLLQNILFESPYEVVRLA